MKNIILLVFLTFSVSSTNAHAEGPSVDDVVKNTCIFNDKFQDLKNKDSSLFADPQTRYYYDCRLTFNVYANKNYTRHISTLSAFNYHKFETGKYIDVTSCKEVVEAMYDQYKSLENTYKNTSKNAEVKSDINQVRCTIAEHAAL